MSNDPKRVQEVFLHLAELSRQQRPAALVQECGSDAELRRRVEDLLKAHDEPDTYLDRPGEDFAVGDSDTLQHHLPMTLGSDADEAVAAVQDEPSPRTDRPQATRAGAARAELRLDLQAGAFIGGRYVLEDKIGEGGMGAVWVATQLEPVKRKVALKLIKSGADSRHVLARFEQERQALAMMDHPNIAKVLDGGITPAGQPFFVMELVNGRPLTKYCDEAKLSPKERLELFVPICHAVQHAHQKGIIHRDLKPANILVTVIDGKPVPKVIDFGVAKATRGKLIDDSLSTQFGAIVGTLEYMSPEQAGYAGADIDTRADVYSLGVILYELLTGLRPIDVRRLKQAALTEMLRILREEEPFKPSTRLSTSESLPSLAAQRQMEPRKLMALLRGELDWVVMKCLEKERDRRYETANDLARDIGRYLSDQPVEARPPSTGYRLGKFLRRNKGPMLAAALVLAALLVGMAGTTLGWIEATRQQRLAEARRVEAVGKRAEAEKQRKRAEAGERLAEVRRGQAVAAQQAEAERAEGERLAKLEAVAKQTEAETQRKRAEAGERLAEQRLAQVEAEKERTEREKKIAEAVKNFLQEKLLNQADVTAQADALLEAGGHVAEAKQNPTIRELLDRAAVELSEEKIEENFPGQPLLQAEILHTVGVTYAGIGEHERAIEFLSRARQLREEALGVEHADTLASAQELAGAYRSAGRLDLALPLYEQTLELMKAEHGEEHTETLTSMNNLALAYLDAGKLDLALPLLEQTLELRRAKLGPDHPHTLFSMSNLAAGYHDAGRLDEFLTLCKETLELRKAKLGPDHPETLTSMNNLAAAYLDAGKPDLALTLNEQALELRMTKFGPDHPGTLINMINLAAAYRDAGRLDEAVALSEKTLEMLKEKLGPDHPLTLIGLRNLAMAYRQIGRLDESVALCEEALKLSKAKLGPDHPDTLTSMNTLAGAYYAAGRLEESLKLYEKTLELLKEKLGPDHPETLACMDNLVGAYADAGRLDEALTLCEQTLKLCQAKLGPDHPDTLTCMNNLAWVYSSAGRLDESLALIEEAFQQCRAKLGPDHPLTLTFAMSVATGYRHAGRLDEALALSEETLKLRQAKLGPDHPDTIASMNNLGTAYWAASQVDKAIPLFEETLRLRKEKLGSDHPDTLTTMFNLAINYQAAGRVDLALPLFEQTLELLESKLGPDHPTTLACMESLAAAYEKAGRLDEARSLRKRLPAP